MTNELYLQEIEIVYSNKIKMDERIHISNSEDAAKALRMVWSKTIEYKESAYIMLVDSANSVLGYYPLSTGGKTSTVVDIILILQVALKSNAYGIILCHNHPSGQKKPSSDDKKITKKLNDACDILGFKLLDHIILTSEDYTSFRDDGIL